MSTRTVVVLGGGIGGVVAARQLRRRLDGDDRVVLIERDLQLRFAPSLLWVLSGARRAEQITRDIRSLRKHGIEVVEDEILALDADAHTVTTKGGVVQADALVVSLGAQLDPGSIPGFAQAAHVIYTLAGAQTAGQALRSLSSGRVAVLVSSTPFKCPAAPYEAAFLAEALLRRRGLGDRVQVDVYTPEILPMPTAGPVVGEALRVMLEERGIGFHPGHSIERVDADARVLRFKDGVTAGYDLLLGVPPHRPPEPVATSTIAGETGYATVDPRTLRTSSTDVYAIGDATAIPIAGGKFLPKAGIFAEAQAKTVAALIAADWHHRGSSASFDGNGSCFVELGEGRAAFATGDFYAPDGAEVTMRTPGRRRHLAKVAFEQYWLRRWL